MKLRLTTPAARQLDRLLDYIAARNPAGARNVQDRIKTFLSLLEQYPQTGAKTKTPGVRRIVIDRYLYAVFYRFGDEEVIVSAIRHTSRRPVHDLRTERVETFASRAERRSGAGPAAWGPSDKHAVRFGLVAPNLGFGRGVEELTSSGVALQ